MSTAYLLTGSNLGNRRQNICRAAFALDEQAGKVISTSGIYESPPWGFDHPNAFLNQAVALHTNLSATALLTVLLKIENQLGRSRGQAGYQARTIDIDILFYDELVVNSEILTIPHPRLRERRFALLPLAEIAGQLPYPGTTETVVTLLENCPDESEVICIEKAPGDPSLSKEECDAL